MVVDSAVIRSMTIPDCHWKAKFDTYSEAQRAMEAMIEKSNRERRGPGFELNVYHCRMHGCYHIGNRRK